MSHELPDDRRQALSPPQFGMRSLLVVVALFCVLFAIANLVGAYAFLGVLMIALSIVAHVVGAVLGKQLRDHGSRPLSSESAVASPRGRPSPDPHDYAPASQLSMRVALGKPLYIATIVGAIGGGIGGGIWIAVYVDHGSRWENLALGVVAFMLLGAFWAFLGCGFLQVLAGAVFHASREPQHRRPVDS